MGRDWRWLDRLGWPDESWRRSAERPELETSLGLSGEEPFGYFELECQERQVQIAYFGLLPEWIGRGLGGPLLTAAIERAWSVPGTRRVWLHTYSLDHPAALENYLRRGFAALSGGELVRRWVGWYRRRIGAHFQRSGWARQLSGLGDLPGLATTGRLVATGKDAIRQRRERTAAPLHRQWSVRAWAP